MYSIITLSVIAVIALFFVIGSIQDKKQKAN